MMHSYTKCMAPDDSASGITNQVKVFIHVAHGRNMAVFGYGNAHAAASTVRFNACCLVLLCTLYHTSGQGPSPCRP